MDRLDEFRIGGHHDIPAMVHETCGDTVCTVEYGDTLEVLAAIATAHLDGVHSIAGSTPTATDDPEYLRLTSALGFGDGLTEPAALPAELLDPLSLALAAARDHTECPEWCDIDGQWEKPHSCGYCHGSGHGGPLVPPVVDAASLDCGWCGGDGRDHIPYTLGGSGVTLTRDQLNAWAGRHLTDDEVYRLDEAIPNSSIPEAIGVIVDSMGDNS